MHNPDQTCDCANCISYFAFNPERIDSTKNALRFKSLREACEARGIPAHIARKARKRPLSTVLNTFRKLQLSK